MLVLSHRGYWKEANEKNSRIAFQRSFDLGFGTETDIRDCQGRLLISHDMPQGNELELSDVLKILENRRLPLALNVKADGLVRPIRNILAQTSSADYFFFDMSIPDMRWYLNEGLPVFTRMSEVEKDPAWFERAAGVWLDAFESTWYKPTLIQKLLDANKRVCIVSPELHGRPHNALWQDLIPLAGHPNLLLCTDFPEQAKIFFGV